MKVLPIVLVAIIAAGAGYWIGKSGSTEGSRTSDTGGDQSPLSIFETDSGNDGGGKISTITKIPETPAEAVQQIRTLLTQEQSNSRDLRFSLAALSLDAETLPGVWAELKGLSEFADYKEHALVEALLARWGEIDPHGALAAAEDLPGWRHVGGIGTVVTNWGKSDPDAAIAWLGGAKQWVQEHTLPSLITEIGKGDRQRGFELYNQALKDHTISQNPWGHSELFSDWAREDPQAASLAAMRLFEEHDSDVALRSSLATWAFKDSAAALAWLDENLSGDTQRRVRENVIESWANREPEAAATHLLALDDQQLWESGLGNVLRGWSMRDFDEARTWIETIEDPERKKDAQIALINAGRWGNSPEEIAEYALPYLDDQDARDSLLNLAWDWGRRDREGSIAWFEENVDDPALVDQFRFRTLSHLVWHNPSQAAEQLAGMPEGQMRQEYYGDVAEQWAGKNLEAARQWVNEMPDGPERDLALGGVTRAWIDQDIDAATQWIDQMESGGIRDQMTARLAAHHAQENQIETALDAARGIADEHRRADTLESTLETWMQRDPNAAREFIEGNEELDDHTRWRLLTPR